MKDININIQELNKLQTEKTQRDPTPRHIVIKPQKAKHRERNLESCKGEAADHIQGILSGVSADFSSETLKDKKQPAGNIQSAKRKKTCNSRILYLVKLSPKSEGEIKTFPNNS